MSSARDEATGPQIIKLTEYLVLQKTKVEAIRNVKNLNLWGNDLQDVSLLRDMPNVEVLSLSINRISSLHDFQFCANLQELYLRKNMIADINEVMYLKNLKHLRILWLCDNPCAESGNYRSIVIKFLPRLEKLDNVDVTPDERARVEKLSERELNIQAPKRRESTKFDAPEPRRQEVRRDDVVEAVRSKWTRNDDDYQQPQPRTEPKPQQNARQAAPQPQYRDPPRERDAGARPKGSNSQTNILTAVLALLNELSVDNLDLIQQEIQILKGSKS